MYLASFRWADFDEPLMIGSNKAKLLKAAKEKAIKEHGAGLVDRGAAMCWARITSDDIKIKKIEVLP